MCNAACSCCSQGVFRGAPQLGHDRGVSELRGFDDDQPADKPAESPGLDAKRIRDLDVAGDAKAFDVSKPTYDPLEHIRPGDRQTVERPGDQPEVPPPPPAARPQLRSLADRIHAAREERFGAQELPPMGPTASAGLDRRPADSRADAERLADAVGSSDETDEDDPDAPASFDVEVWERVPERGNEVKTRGIFVDETGDETDLVSGYNGPSADLPKPRTGMGMNRTNLSHVEAHAAATMRLKGIEEGTLYINNQPCVGRNGCDRWLPRMLPPDGKLTVYSVDDYCKVYRGLPEEER